MRRVRGFTLIEVFVALMILALAAAVRSASTTAYALVPEPLALRQVEDAVARAHADSLARAAIQQALAIVAGDDPAVDHPSEPWARRLTATPAENATLTGAIADEQAKLNLNNLARGEAPSPADVAALRRLIALVGLPGSLADAIIDWLDPEDVATPRGLAENGVQFGGEPSYRAVRRGIADVRVLAQVKGMTPEALARLAPYLTALPDETSVNINTASATVLRAVVPFLSDVDAVRIVQERDRAPFRGREEILRALPGATGSVDVKSRFFSAEATVQVGRVAIGHRALIERGERRRAVIVALAQVVP